MSYDLKLATGPVTWGVDFAHDPENPPWEDVLDDIERSGVGALELGPIGYLPEEPTVLRNALRSRGLTAVGSFIFDDLHEPPRRDEVILAAERACGTIAAAGGTVLVIIDRPGPERVATAGRSDEARRMTSIEWKCLLGTIEDVAAIALERGLRPAVHPHAGGFIEFADEVERLVADTTVGLCLDTGHLAYSGVTPESALAVYADRVAHVHLKDVRREVLRRVHVESLDFWSALRADIFCPLGEGVVDLKAVIAELREIGYDGYATIEQDRRPGGAGRPLDDLAASVAAIRRASDELG